MTEYHIQVGFRNSHYVSVVVIADDLVRAREIYDSRVVPLGQKKRLLLLGSPSKVLAREVRSFPPRPFIPERLALRP